MAQIIIPGKLMQQPQGPVEVDPRFFDACTPHGTYLMNHVTKKLLPKTNTTTGILSPVNKNIGYGIWQSNGNNPCGFLAERRAGLTSLSFVLSFTRIGNVYDSDLFLIGQNGNTNRNYISLNINGTLSLVVKTGDFDTNTTIIWPVLASSSVVINWNGGYDFSLYEAGKLVTPSSVTNGSVITTLNNNNNYHFSAQTYRNGAALHLTARTLKPLTSIEAASISENPWQIFKPLKRQFWSEAPNLLSPRYARPLLDISNSGWSASSGSDLYAMIDEETPSDTDYIFATTSGSTYEAKLQPVTDPNTAINQIIKYRTRSLYNNTLIAKLKQGSTVIATRTHTNVPSEWTTYSMVLSESEANAITDYTDLRIHTEIA